jgi:hypothetical protein
MKNKLIGISLLVLAVAILLTSMFNLQFPIWPLPFIMFAVMASVQDYLKKDYENAVLSMGIATILVNRNYHLINLSLGKHLLVVVLILLAVSYFTPNKVNGEFLNFKITIKNSLENTLQKLEKSNTSK